MSVAQTGPIIKELAKQAVDIQASNKGSAKSKGKKDKEAEKVKEKPKRKTPPDFVPHSTEV